MSTEVQLLLDGMPESALPRFNTEQHRAFGSLPGLVGRNLEIPDFPRLDNKALERVTPEGIARGLYGREDRYTVDGLVHSAEEYTGIVRNVPAFRSSISATILQANRMTNGVRAAEKQLKGTHAALTSKRAVHETVISGLANEAENLKQLKEWQKVPGFWRTSELEMRLKGNQAWNYSFRHILDVLKDQYELSPEEHIDMIHAMAYKLFRGPQTERVKYWGEMLGAGQRYNKARRVLFTQRTHVIDSSLKRIDTQIEKFQAEHGI